MTRREIRDKVFKILFSLEFNPKEDMKEQVELALSGDIPAEEEDGAFVMLACSDEDKAYITKRVLDIVDNHEEIDSSIEEVSEGWKLSRIGKAELAILRLAVFEMRYDDDIPVKVAINEAVELAKVYCDVDAKKFINALLAKLTKQV